MEKNNKRPEKYGNIVIGSGQLQNYISIINYEIKK